MRLCTGIIAVFFICCGAGALTAQTQSPGSVSASQKKEFIELLRTLPHQGEFFTQEAVTKSEPYLSVLLALTEKDIEGLDFFAFGAISRGLCDRKKNRRYVAGHFSGVLHPDLKLSWAVMLFDDGVSNPDIVQFLQGALKSESQAHKLREMMGPHFEDFEKRVLSHRAG